MGPTQSRALLADFFVTVVEAPTIGKGLKWTRLESRLVREMISKEDLILFVEVIVNAYIEGIDVVPIRPVDSIVTHKTCPVGCGKQIEQLDGIRVQTACRDNVS